MKFKACEYFVCGAHMRPIPVRGFAVGGLTVDGEPVRIAVHENNPPGDWVADDWDTGMRLSNLQQSKPAAVRAALQTICAHGMDACRKKQRTALMAGALRGDQ